jgi:hypothetical protein
LSLPKLDSGQQDCHVNGRIHHGGRINPHHKLL